MLPQEAKGEERVYVSRLVNAWLHTPKFEFETYLKGTHSKNDTKI